jgi:hypothetical protein
MCQVSYYLQLLIQVPKADTGAQDPVQYDLFTSEVCISKTNAV